ncbi:hypothetical protein [Streptomyces sp. A1136]|uniref:hypothetical protein n=1 Tax=Streptomyces sp. A1136 TaxID=2563102 RepID=UPI00109E9F5E|nr:hypothetical protein [Streptomyces sp. A1136]THA47971.1 hypothetical protein E6R62_29995 [Streptomyces sp. A1136]
MSAAPPPEPADEDGEPSEESRPPRGSGAAAGGRTGFARLHGWQGLLGALVTAAAAVVVALIARTPGEPRPEPTPAPDEGPSVSIHRAWEHDDPAAPAPAVLVDFEGTVTGLDPDSTVFAMVRRPDERSGWPAELAQVDRRSGKWRAVVHVPRPQPPLEITAGVVSSGFYGAVPPGASSIPSAPPTAPAGRELGRLRDEGPSAAGVETSMPFRHVAPATPSPAPGG